MPATLIVALATNSLHCLSVTVIENYDSHAVAGITAIFVYVAIQHLTRGRQVGSGGVAGRTGRMVAVRSKGRLIIGRESCVSRSDEMRTAVEVTAPTFFLLVMQLLAISRCTRSGKPVATLIGPFALLPAWGRVAPTNCGMALTIGI